MKPMPQTIEIEVTEMVEITCTDCQSKTEVRIESFGTRFMSRLATYCPRCGSAEIQAEQRWD